MPPRHGKSMTVTETFPSWFLGRNPGKRVIVSSYSGSLAERFGRFNRRKVEEWGQEIFGIKVSTEKATQSNWEIEGTAGGMLSLGIGAGITGSGSDLLLIDDPVKNSQEAESVTYRERVWDEWQSTLRTRLHPGASVIVILTRWHEDDLAGRLLNPEFGKPDKWDIISLPAECESKEDPLGRAIGDPLWGSFGFDHAWMDSTKNAVGSRVWASLYQQRPSPASGNIFNRSWWRFYDSVPPVFEEIIQSWDCAFKGTDHSDFVVGQVWGRTKADKYLLDQVRGRMNFPETLQAIRSLSEKWSKSYTKLIEDKANGSAVIDTLRREISGLIPVNPEGGKEARANAIVSQIESGNVYLPSVAVAPWIRDFIEECSSFPNSVNDDQVDAMTQALFRLQNKKDVGIRFL